MPIPRTSQTPQAILPAILLGLLLALPPVGAGASEPQSHRCAVVVEAGARLACYDAAFPPGTGVRIPSGQAGAQHARALADFGLDERQLHARDPEAAERIPARIEARIASVTRRQTGERVVTLDNGQVWLLTEVSSRGRLDHGDPVVVRKAALGSYMLVTEGRLSLRARRVR